MRIIRNRIRIRGVFLHNRIIVINDSNLEGSELMHLAIRELLENDYIPKKGLMGITQSIKKLEMDNQYLIRTSFELK